MEAQTKLLIMRLFSAVLVIFVCGLSNCRADNPKPFKTLDLSEFAPHTSECDQRSILPNHALWVDSEHLVVWLITTCKLHTGKWESTNSLVFIDSDGGKTQVLQPSDMGAFSRGPDNTILVEHGSAVDVLKSDLQVVQTIECPEVKHCAVYPSPSELTDSDFALCSTSRPTEHCILYKGLPAEQLSRTIDTAMYNGVIPKSPYPDVASANTLPTSPYSRVAWRIDDKDVWFFDGHGVLTTMSAGNSSAPVSTEQWSPKDSNCTGELSSVEPKRFLATCTGAHIYTDGELDNLFGYSRVALFDVRSKRLLYRVDGRAYTFATVSTDGRRIATIHRRTETKIEVKLYEVN